MNEESSRTRWIIDSGTSHHITAEELLFLNSATQTSVMIGDKSLLPFTGQGEVPMQVCGKQFVLKGELLVPGIAPNLLSVLAATNRPGVTFRIAHGVWTLLCKGQTLIEATCVNGGLPSFIAEHANCNGALLCESKRSLELWHRRLRHAGFGSLARIQRENLVTGVDTPALEFMEAEKNVVCEPCQMGKQPKGPYCS
jgi:hypothetical protein